MAATATTRRKVSPSKVSEEPLVIAEFDTSRKDWIQQLCRWFKKWVDGDEATFTDIAARAGVVIPTVSRLYHNEVKHPWADKLMQILGPGLQLEVRLVMSPTSKKGGKLQVVDPS